MEGTGQTGLPKGHQSMYIARIRFELMTPLLRL